MSLLDQAQKLRRLTILGIRRETTLGWCRAFIKDTDRLLRAIEEDNVKDQIGGNTARLVKLATDKSFLKVAVHETFISMRKYGESLDSSPRREEEIETEVEEEEIFSIKEKKKNRNKNLSPVGEYFQN